MARMIGYCMRIIEIPMLYLQKRLGISRLAWVFLLPNLLLFGFFAFLPVILNFVYAMTGSDQILLQDRTFVGMGNYQTLTSCENFLDPNSCRDDLFWRAVGAGDVFELRLLDCHGIDRALSGFIAEDDL